MLEIRKAVRKAAPMLLSISSVSGGGKTYSALLLAAGLAGVSGRVGLIDTENGRGEMYADSPGIVKALPQGYGYLRIDPPFSPERYTEHIAALEQAGYDVGIVDSATHEWAGIGGCCEIAEKNPLGKMPNWAKAKMAHKRFVNHCLTSKMHLIFCLRAQEKVKVFKRGDAIVTSVAELEEKPQIADKDCIVPIGLQPVTEKAFIFEMLVSLMLAEHTHHAIPVKVPEPLVPLFPGRHLITKEDGDRIRQWNNAGSAANPIEQLAKRSRAAAEDGVELYKVFWSELTVAQRKSIEHMHSGNKRIAEEADAAANAENLKPIRMPTPADIPPADLKDLAEWPDQPIDRWYRVKGVVYREDDAAGNYQRWKGVA